MGGQQAPADMRMLVDRVFAAAMARRASDVHVEPEKEGWDLRFRIDGELETAEKLEVAVGRAVVGRMMVMAKLLTYRLDVPQEGRISLAIEGEGDGEKKGSVELRLAVMPTIHGLRAAVRMPADHVQAAVLEDLNLPGEVLAGLRRFAGADSGMLILTGPAGSGKTTTIYALLREIAKRAGAAIVALEDPVERELEGVTQIEVSPFGQLTYERALRSILRQDPQVLMLGEIRDAATASLAVQAALSGHRLITTLHAATAGGAIGRLMEMGVEPYQLTSSLYGVVSQRLVRRKAGAVERGRVPVAQWVSVDAGVKKGILERADADGLEAIYSKQAGYRSLGNVGKELVEGGIVDGNEMVRLVECR